MANNGPFNIEEIRGSRGEMTAIDALQSLGITTNDMADRILGSEFLILDERLQLAGQSLVFDEQGMSAKDGAILGAELFGNGSLVRLSLSGRGAQSTPHALNFFGD